MLLNDIDANLKKKIKPKEKTISYQSFFNVEIRNEMKIRYLSPKVR